MQGVKQLHKNKILSLAARDEGFQVDMYDRNQEQLRSRMRIFQVQNLVYVEKYGRDKLVYKITKETHLL